MNRGFFITGTDTGCGKTLVTTSLMRLLDQQGVKVMGLKPVASGAEHTPHGLHNDDVLAIQRQASTSVAYHEVNAYTFEAPVSPHLAARQAGRPIEFNAIGELLKKASSRSDWVLVEGVGGWLAPLTDSGETVADLAAYLKLPIILVAGMRLGCLNHTMLTVQAIHRSGQNLAAWVANCLDPDMKALQENLAYLRTHIEAPCLGLVPFHKEAPSLKGLEQDLDLTPLIGRAYGQ